MRKIKLLMLVIAVFALFVTVVSAEGCDNKTSIKKEEYLNKIKAAKEIKLEKLMQSKLFRLVYDDGEGNYSLVSSELGKTKGGKEKVFAKLKSISAENYNDSISDISSKAYNDGYIFAEFDSDFFVDNTGWYEVTVNGNSEDSWTGYTPFYADSINASDTFDFDGISVSLYISYPPGGSVSGSSSCKTINYPTINNEYVYTHSYANVNADGFSIYRFKQNHSNTFLFGNHTESNACSDSTIIW